jgi:hypothetical protein
MSVLLHKLIITNYIQVVWLIIFYVKEKCFSKFFKIDLVE